MVKKVNVMFPENVLAKVDAHVKGNYHNRSVFMTEALKEKLAREVKDDKK